MKTIMLVVALLPGCFLSVYSQLNPDRKPGAANRYDNFDHHKFDHDFSCPTITLQSESPIPLPAIKTPLTIVPELFSGDNMPCFVPEGNFTMKVVGPDHAMGYSMLIKKIIIPQYSVKRQPTTESN